VSENPRTDPYTAAGTVTGPTKLTKSSNLESTANSQPHMWERVSQVTFQSSMGTDWGTMSPQEGGGSASDSNPTATNPQAGLERIADHLVTTGNLQNGELQDKTPRESSIDQRMPSEEHVRIYEPSLCEKWENLYQPSRAVIQFSIMECLSCCWRC